MSSTRPNDPISPIVPPIDETGHVAVGFPELEFGLSKREYMATTIFAQIRAVKTSHQSDQSIAQAAVRATDALIGALNGDQQE